MPKKGRTYGQDILRGEYAGLDGEGSIGKRFAPGQGGATTKKYRAIPGGETGKNSAYMFKTEDGYQTGDEAQANGAGTSIFDPVLCELAYSWFCPPGGLVLDPFAGGSVRGIVASTLGRRYLGIDLSAAQIKANKAQSAKLCKDPMPQWIEGDSRAMLPEIDADADFVFSCPPYFDLEQYSDHPRDLSAMAWGGFLEAYGAIIAAACAKLRADRFAAFVVGDIRDKSGFYRNFPGETIAAFEKSGLRFYNEAILVTMAGSLPIRAGKQFESSRKLGKTHQNLLVFVKGDPARATKACGKCQFGDIANPDDGGFEIE